MYNKAAVFSVALDVARLAVGVVSRHCDNNSVFKDLICLLALGSNSKIEDILTAFVNYLEKKTIGIKKKFCVTADGALQW